MGRLPSRNWFKLKKEYLKGDYPTVNGFLKEKGIPYDRMRRPVAVKGWARDKRELEKQALIASTQSIIQRGALDIAGIRLRQQRISRFMQLKGAEGLKITKVRSVGEARKLVVSGLEQERRALGMEGGEKQSLTQINIEAPKTNLDKLIEKLDYEGILELIAELKRLGTGSSIAKTVDGSSGEIEEGKTL